ncbi:MAG TPA: cobalt ECF transporter T component CbiQ [Anaerolineae bacterium]|nr:cobalt ECF transporter T component CbiQ [Anaerolineae bacterium]HQK12959.1 cobalt ECF transporter T component CbiQ [Anaerolineae bacterium]
MYTHSLDPYRPRASVVHGLDPRVKLGLTLAFIVTTALTPPGAWPIFIVLCALSLATTLLSELGVGYVLTRALLALPFALVALPTLFTTTGMPLLTLPASLPLTLTVEGVARFAGIAFKSWLSVQMAVILVGSTPFPDLLLAMRALKIPRLLAAIVGLMWRYLFVLADEALRLLRARESRSAAAHDGRGRRVGGSLIWRARVTGGMVGNLFLRAFDRADRIYAAMLARGYDGEVRALPRPPLRAGQWMVLGMGLALLTFLALAGFLLWG